MSVFFSVQCTNKDAMDTGLPPLAFGDELPPFDDIEIADLLQELYPVENSNEPPTIDEPLPMPEADIIPMVPLPMTVPPPEVAPPPPQAFDPPAETFTCDYPGCNKTFNLRRSLTDHMRRTHGDKIYKCPQPQCAQTFTRPDNLRTHVEFTHEKDFEEKCPVCPEKFREPWNVKRHMKSHRSKLGATLISAITMRYHCNLCGRDSISQKDITAHLESHSVTDPKVVERLTRLYKQPASAPAATVEPPPAPEPIDVVKRLTDFDRTYKLIVRWLQHLTRGRTVVLLQYAAAVNQALANLRTYYNQELVFYNHFLTVPPPRVVTMHFIG
jgi:hypothetical protein